MICPLISKPENNDHFGRFIDCIKEQCAWWVLFVNNSGEKSKTQGECAVKLMGENR